MTNRAIFSDELVKWRGIDCWRKNEFILLTNKDSAIRIPPQEFHFHFFIGLENKKKANRIINYDSLLLK
jgi:hypothetical protein